MRIKVPLVAASALTEQRGLSSGDNLVQWTAVGRLQEQS